jgi:hypothetical protein
MNSNTPFILYFYCRLWFWGILNKLGYSLQNSPRDLWKLLWVRNFCNTQFSLRKRISTISTSHKHYNNFSRIYILKFPRFVRRIYVGINIYSKVLNFKNVLNMLVMIGPHSLNTLQAHVIGKKWYCDNVMGGAIMLHPVLNPSSLYYLTVF